MKTIPSEMLRIQQRQPRNLPASGILEEPINPANTRHLYNIYTTSAQRLRRWSIIA